MGEITEVRFVVLIESKFFYFRDNADDFIAANRFSDLLVKVNLDESDSVSKASAAVDARAPSSPARPSDYPDGTKAILCVCVRDTVGCQHHRIECCFRKMGENDLVKVIIRDENV